MNLLLNRDFKMPEDGWYQLAPLGEFAHAAAGVVQVVDAEACAAMVSRFKAEAAMPNFARLLVDFDHFSLDDRARSEAAGWIVALEGRCQRSEVSDQGSAEELAAKDHKGDAGLWAKIRWSDVGEEAVKGGRYRFLSPVWARSDCVDLGNGRVRPIRLLNAAVTNDPNLKGLVPLANTSAALNSGGPVDSCASYRGACGRAEGGDLKPESENAGKTMKNVIEALLNRLGLAADAAEGPARTAADGHLCPSRPPP